MIHSLIYNITFINLKKYVFMLYEFKDNQFIDYICIIILMSQLYNFFNLFSNIFDIFFFFMKSIVENKIDIINTMISNT